MHQKLQRKNDKIKAELERMKENFEISKQILLETLNVKLSYEGIIQKALGDKSIENKMRKIIRSNYKNNGGGDNNNNNNANKAQQKP